MKLELKIMLAAMGAVALATASSVAIVYHLSSSNRVTELRGKMSSIIAQSEQVASNMDDLYRSKAFDASGLLATAKSQATGKSLRESYQSTDLYKTIPIVASWKSVEASAEKNGFKFFTPASPGAAPRNAKNASSAEYAAVFDAFEKGATEYFGRDSKTGELVLARPVLLQGSCLSCHGDPAKSPTGDGKDILGFPMENMKMGELRGAFVLKADIGHDPIIMATMRSMVLGGLIVLGLVAVGFYYFNRHLIALPLNEAIEQIQQASSQTAAAAVEISRTSTSLAEGASGQAASLEETSASLEEVASMTKRNAENSHQATELAKQARHAAENGATDMRQMNAAMDAIKSSSDDIAKIIKTIDEIAFQTNILALNAAVEAARAGEAGMGFAVVAEEVRSLAQRSATAAKETSAKIEGAIQRTGQGVALSGKVAEALNTIVARARQVDELAAEVASASNEQSQGISQVNLAVGEMDRVTQTNAAASEQSASAAEQLKTQAATLHQAVARLTWIVSGEAQDESQAHTSAAASRRTVSRHSARPAARATAPKAPAAADDDALVKWDPSTMATGIDEVDDEHQELIAMINRLHKACLNGTGKAELREMMNFLAGYVQTHFAHEEEVMAREHCPAEAKNKIAHQKFLETFTKLMAEFEAKGATTSVLVDLKRLVADWLTNHICTIDMQLYRGARNGRANGNGKPHPLSTAF
jgi:methyl-accepting chemotaxis protein